MTTHKTPVIEYHIIQSFPVTCLNRDDVGAPKSATVGGIPRARVSSQCWKRQVRLALRDLNVQLGQRTKKIEILLEKALSSKGATPEQTEKWSKAITGTISDVADAKKTLTFLCEDDTEAFATAAADAGFDADDKTVKKTIKSVLKPDFRAHISALDIALFGRMVARAPTMNVEAAASFSHAISTHRSNSEVEFFTALDDLSEEPGSAHMGNLEFNSATYYRYISLNLGQLAATLGAEAVPDAVVAFSRALFVAIPEARQHTQSGASPWDFARIMVRHGQRVQCPFDRAVRPDKQNGGYSQPSIEALKEWLANTETAFGKTFFQKYASYDWGNGASFSVDELISSLSSDAKTLIDVK